MFLSKILRLPADQNDKMKLYEFEGHKIFSKVGIESPFFVVASNLEEVEQAKKRLNFPIVAKVQVLSGKRGKHGGVKVCNSTKEINRFAKEFFGKDFLGEEISYILLAQKADVEVENYISITYDTVLKCPFLMFSEKGGMDIEEVQKSDPGAIVRVDIDPNVGLLEKDLRKIFKGSDSLKGSILDSLVDFALRLWDVFSKYDCRLVEVNPLARLNVTLEGSGNSRRPIESKTGKVSIASLQNDSFIALDSKVILDDSGLSRHKELDILPKGSAGAVPTAREILAKKIDEEDYRGSAGSSFIELDGDIAILASGGGASLLVMDSVAAAGGKCANYTEYSGNPPREKVRKLTEIVLGREGLSGCLVCGAVANFTDIFETLSGFAEGLRLVKPKPSYPIVVRRGGPRQKEAYVMLEKLVKKEGFDIHLFGPETPISVAAKKMVGLSSQFKSQK